FLLFDYTPTPVLYTLSLHDALPICARGIRLRVRPPVARDRWRALHPVPGSRLVVHEHHDGGKLRVAVFGFLAHACPEDLGGLARSEEHTSELQSRENLVCRLLLEKK